MDKGSETGMPHRFRSDTPAACPTLFRMRVPLYHVPMSEKRVGDDPAVELLYDELRTLAHAQLARESGPPDLRTTELVHEAWLRLADDERVLSRGRAYFFGAAARAMRRILIDAARRRNALRRGGDRIRVTLGEADAAVEAHATELLDLDRALTELEAESPRLAQVVELRFFGGLSVEETAEALEVSPRTVKGDWAVARHWLRDALQAGA
jgi:RNA polymerase sigma factor (TIGR02999 family)